MNPPRSAGRRSFQAAQRCAGARGFSLIEVMVAGVLGGVIVTSAVGMSNLNQRTILETGQRERAETVINSDIDLIREKMISYTWCSGQGSVEPSSDRSRCRLGLSGRGKREYYSPNQNTPANPNLNASGDRDNFLNACRSTGSGNSNAFLSPLISSINSQQLASSSGVTRSVTISDARTKRLQITYSGPTSNRSLLMTPTVAAWCP
jgi:prepilin-type N-terminal cleavage/methylation domain-containing protein